MKIYASFGLTEFVLCLGYKGDMIKEYFLNYQAMDNDFIIRLGSYREIECHGSHQEEDFRVTLASTGEHSMTGSRVKRVECVAVLEADSTLVLAYPRTMNILADGTHTREKVRPFNIRSMTPQQRFREVMWRVDCNYVYGMFRLPSMLDTHIFQLIPAADRVFLAEMALKGPFASVDTFKYYRANRVGIQPELEKRHRLMRYLFPHKTFTDAALAGNEFYAPTLRAFQRAVQDATFPWYLRVRLRLSVWLCGVMKFHLFPGADTLSFLVKRMLPKPLLQRLLRTMQ